MKIARLFVAILLASALSPLAADELAERLQPALEAITPDGLLAHIKILASDEFEGRAPGTGSRANRTWRSKLAIRRST
jgi:hypothetical protein